MTHRRRRRMWLGAVVLVVLASLAGAAAWVLHMPGRSFTGELPALSAAERLTRDRLRAHVATIAAEEHNVWTLRALAAVEHHIATELAQLGIPVTRHGYDTPYGRAVNLEVTFGNPRSQQVVVIGAHYDSVQGTPGADDNASGVAAEIEIVRLLMAAGPWPASAPALKVVFFANEEMPFFASPLMGSHVYASDLEERGRHVVAMYSLETIGYYQDAPGSQSYPWPFGLIYPQRGDFLAFVGDLRSRRLVRDSIAAFRAVAHFPSEGIAAPPAVPGVDWSDHWAFRQQGWAAVMITDTAFYRNPHYHTPHDTPATLDYDRLARVVHGLSQMLLALFGRPNG